MAVETARVTVVGTSKRVDVTVPARAAIVEYVDVLAGMCGEQSPDTLPAAWSLGPADRRALAPSSSLRQAGIVDGQVLHLRDLTDGEYDEPLRLEAEELVGQAASRAGGPRWDRHTRMAALLAFTALWFAGTTVAWAAGSLPRGGGAGLAAVCAALLPACLAWAVRRPGSRLNVPAGVTIGLALTAVPGLAVAGLFLGRSSGHAGAPVVGASIGALLGLQAALAAAPCAAAFALLVLALPVALAADSLAVYHANGTEDAAVAAVGAYLLMAAGPSLAGGLAAAWGRLSNNQDTELMVRKARGMLMVGDVAVAIVLAAALIRLGSGADRYGLGLAACLAAASLLHTGACTFLYEAAPSLAAGLIGCAALALRAPATLGAPPWVTLSAGLGFGLLLLVAALATAWRTRERPAAAAAARVCAALCSVAAVVLTVGVFGVFQQMAELGRHL